MSDIQMVNRCLHMQLSDKPYHKDLSETLTYDVIIEYRPQVYSLWVICAFLVWFMRMKHIMTEAIGEPTSHKDRSEVVHGSYPQRPRWKSVTCVTSELKYRP